MLGNPRFPIPCQLVLATGANDDHWRRASPGFHAEARVREPQRGRQSVGQASETRHRSFCGFHLSRNRRVHVYQPIQIGGSDSDIFSGAFYLTDQQIADCYWMVVFVPSMIVFALSVVYLVAGMTVACSAPTRHGCLKVVENNYCASRRGGVRCLSILNLIFAIFFGLLALFLGSSLLTMVSNCSKPLFWCYEISSWGLVVLYGGTAFFLRRKAAMFIDEGNFSGRNLGLEMLEVSPLERRVNEGFKAWMGSSLLSSDEEDELYSYDEALHTTSTNSNRQRL